MDNTQKDRVRQMVDELRSAGTNYGLLAKQGTVIMRGPGTTYEDRPTIFDESDLSNAIALGLLEKRRMVGSFEWDYYVVSSDFTGKTASEATDKLWRFVKKTASETGSTLSYDNGAITVPGIQSMQATGRGQSGEVFYIEVSCDEEGYAKIKHQANPLEREFGAGSITKRDARIMLKLRLDNDGLYRWYGSPIELSKNVKAVIPSDGHRFPLTEEYVADGIRALQETGG